MAPRGDGEGSSPGTPSEGPGVLSFREKEDASGGGRGSVGGG